MKAAFAFLAVLALGVTAQIQPETSSPRDAKNVLLESRACSAVGDDCSSKNWLIFESMFCCPGLVCDNVGKSLITRCRTLAIGDDLTPPPVKRDEGSVAQAIEAEALSTHEPESFDSPDCAGLGRNCGGNRGCCGNGRCLQFSRNNFRCTRRMLTHEDQPDIEDKFSPIALEHASLDEPVPIAVDISPAPAADILGDTESQAKCGKNQADCSNQLCCAGLICAHFNRKYVNPPTKCIPWPDRDTIHTELPSV